MIKINLPHDPLTMLVMREIIEKTVESVEGGIVLDIDIPDADEELAEAWEMDLVGSLREDFETLRRALSKLDEGENRNELVLSESEAEGLVRAISALRLKIRNTALADFEDEELEMDLVDEEGLPPDQHLVYVCYCFLVSLQNRVVLGLDPEAFE